MGRSRRQGGRAPRPPRGPAGAAAGAAAARALSPRGRRRRADDGRVHRRHRGRPSNDPLRRGPGAAPTPSQRGGSQSRGDRLRARRHDGPRPLPCAAAGGHPRRREVPARSPCAGVRPHPADVDGVLRHGTDGPTRGAHDVGHRLAPRAHPTGTGGLRHQPPALRLHGDADGRPVAAPVGRLPRRAPDRARRQHQVPAQFQPRLPPRARPDRPDAVDVPGGHLGRARDPGVRA